MRKLGKVSLAGAAAFLLLQAVRPGIPTRVATAELQAPPDIKRILERDCYSCHSDQLKLSWFDQVVPAYWLVRRDILTAREHLNFSTLGSKPPAAQKAALFEAVNMIQFGAMPLPQFTLLHPEAKVTAGELMRLKTFLSPWTPLSAATPAPSDPDHSQQPDGRVSPELNGLPFDSDFESWKPISTTDRGDNDTFRFILGNEVAVKAAQSGNISPWPDGSRFAKIAWQQELGSDGLVHPGKFIQVEFMIKDARGHRDTEGWAWGRWRGLDLKPYGSDAQFVRECTGCHRPMRANDYVYTLPITRALARRNDVVNNSAAALPESLPYQPLSWNAITMYVAPATHFTAVLYGNDAAIGSIRAHRGTTHVPAYAAGAVLALVTWAQREDPHWFGARIPSEPQSVEFVQVQAAQKNEYRRFAGPGLTEDRPSPDISAQRTNHLLDLAPALLP